MARPLGRGGATRGTQLAALRKAFRVGQIALAQAAGISRSELAQLETDKLQWKSETDWQGLCRAFGLQRETLRAYLDNEMDLAEVTPLCAAAIEQVKRARDDQRDVNARARAALVDAGLDDHELADLITIFLRRYIAQDPLATDGHLIDRAHAACAALVRAEHALQGPVSHKSATDRVRARR